MCVELVRCKHQDVRCARCCSSQNYNNYSDAKLTWISLGENMWIGKLFKLLLASFGLSNNDFKFFQLFFLTIPLFLMVQYIRYM